MKDPFDLTGIVALVTGVRAGEISVDGGLVRCG
jgi:hypothetical protein